MPSGEIALRFKKSGIAYSSDKNELLEISRNFSGAFEQPLFVVSPKTTNDVEQIVQIATYYQLPIAVKGFGHSTARQQEVPGGLLINIRTLNQIRGISVDEQGQAVIDIDAGASWEELIEFSLKHQLMPYVFTDWLLLTLGGTLSFGGVGSASYRYGLQTDHIKQACIVSGKGKSLIVNATKNQALFNAARAGAGQFGIFTQFHIALTKCPQKCTVYKLVYTNLEAFLKDNITLMVSMECDAIIAHAERYVPEVTEKKYGLVPGCNLEKNNWLIILELTVFDSRPGINPAQGLSGKLAATESYTTKDYLNRYPPILDAFSEKNNLVHEECIHFLPFSQASLDYIAATLDYLINEDSPYGLLLFVPMKRSVIRTPAFIHPNDELFFMLGVLFKIPDDSVSRIKVKDILRQCSLKALEIGGCRYLCDSMENTNWHEHYGEKWHYFEMLKKKYNPDNLYSPGLYRRYD